MNLTKGVIAALIAFDNPNSNAIHSFCRGAVDRGILHKEVVALLFKLVSMGIVNRSEDGKYSIKELL